MKELLGLDTPSLPVIWDADFLYGPGTSSGTTRSCCVRLTSAPSGPSLSKPSKSWPAPPLRAVAGGSCFLGATR